VFVVDGVWVEKEGSADKALGKEVGREIREPTEDVESCAGFEHKEGYRLSHEQADHRWMEDRSFDKITEGELKQDETHDGDGTITIFRAQRDTIYGSVGGAEAQHTHILELKAERGAEDDREWGEPAHAIANVFWDGSCRRGSKPHLRVTLCRG